MPILQRSVSYIRFIIGSCRTSMLWWEANVVSYANALCSWGLFWLINSFIDYSIFPTLLRENTVTSCRHCNGRKGCLRPAQLHTVGMTLKTKPRCPSLYELAAEANKFVPRRVHPSWAPFLGIDTEHVDTRSQRNGSSLPRP